MAEAGRSTALGSHFGASLEDLGPRSDTNGQAHNLPDPQASVMIHDYSPGGHASEYAIFQTSAPTTHFLGIFGMGGRCCSLSVGRVRLPNCLINAGNNTLTSTPPKNEME